jgi:hypothetical protein
MATYYYDEKLKKVVEAGNTRTLGTPNFGISVTECRSPKDGSLLDKPMSRTYIDHIYSRTSSSIQKMKPNMGAYGA